VLFLTFQLGDDLCALEAGRIVEVLPLVHLKPLPHAHAGVAGLLNYRGRPVVALDLSAMVLDRASSRRMSTRIAVVRWAPAGRSEALLGLILERASGVVARAASDFADTGYRHAEARYLGPVATLEDGRLLQRIEPQHLISAAVIEALQAGEGVDA
jgi:chemotaxis-related protein WspB